MPKVPTYRRLLKQPTESLEAKVSILSEEEQRSATGSVPRKRLLRLLRKEIFDRSKEASKHSGN
ncbi:MAG: hypothetical protein EOO60_11140 [Hymenobacter sp.]|nr:MAG: hypothetical protein EOO60_11140 [Hymenobacter sp.]